MTVPLTGGAGYIGSVAPAEQALDASRQSQADFRNVQVCTSYICLRQPASGRESAWML